MKPAALISIVLSLLLIPASAAVAAPTTQPAHGARSAPTSQPDCTWSGVERIVAVGDVHGDFDRFVLVLRAAKVINQKNDWIGGKTHLVQTGDVLDRGPDSRKAMDLLMKLESQAPKAGGLVHPLLGNHEMMVPLGDWRYVSRGEIDAFGSPEAFREAMSAKGKYGRWLRGHNAIIRINDVLFLHGGISLTVSKMKLSAINQAVRKQLAEGRREGLGMSSEGPLWDRGLALGEPAVVDKKLDIILPNLAARHVVIGHTVDREGVLCEADGRLFRIDVGLSSVYGGPAACLLIEKGVFSEVRAGKPTRLLHRDPPTTQPDEQPAPAGAEH